MKIDGLVFPGVPLPDECKSEGITLLQLYTGMIAASLVQGCGPDYVKSGPTHIAQAAITLAESLIAQLESEIP